MTRLDKNTILVSKMVSEYIKAIVNEGTETQYKVFPIDFFHRSMLTLEVR